MKKIPQEAIDVAVEAAAQSLKETGITGNPETDMEAALVAALPLLMSNMYWFNDELIQGREILEQGIINLNNEYNELRSKVKQVLDLLPTVDPGNPYLNAKDEAAFMDSYDAAEIGVDHGWDAGAYDLAHKIRKILND